MFASIIKVLIRILTKTKILKQGKRVPKTAFNSIQNNSKLASDIYDSKLASALRKAKLTKSQFDPNYWKRKATKSIYKRLLKDDDKLPKLETLNDNMTKRFNDDYSANGDEMESVVLGLDASFILWGIYEPIPYMKNFGNLTLRFRHINKRTGVKISSTKNPTLTYKWGIGQKQPPIAYWMWEEVVKSANGGTTFWNLFWRDVKKLETTRKEYYKQNNLKVPQNKDIINKKVGSKKFNKAQERKRK